MVGRIGKKVTRNVQKSNAADGSLKNDNGVKSKIRKEPIKKRNKTQDLVEKYLVDINQRTRDVFRHHVVPGFNLGKWPTEKLCELNNYPACSLLTPRPIYITLKDCRRVDKCFERTLACRQYFKRLYTIRTKYNTALKKYPVLKSLENNSIHHDSIFNLAEQIERNPDPFFYGRYDYYYTSGNLCALPESGNIVHVEGKNLRKLVVSEFDAEKSAMEAPLKVLNSEVLDKNSEIFEVQHLKNCNNERLNCFVVRQKNIIHFFCTKTNHQLKPLTQFRSNKTPFISCAHSPYDFNKFLVGNMKQQVRIYDLNRFKPVQKALFQMDSTGKIGWNTIKPCNAHTFLYANERQIVLMDTRTTAQDWLRNSYTLPTHHFNCDLISSIAKSQFEHLMYVGTNHKLHCLDARYIKKNNETKNMVTTWTHQMEYPPMLMDTLRWGSNEFIALSSMFEDDLCICELTQERNLSESALETDAKYLYKSKCLPYQPTTIKEAYEHARLAGKCLQPNANLKNRINCCTTGLMFLNPYQTIANETTTRHALLLTSNSNGDVYARNVTERETQEFEPRCSTEMTTTMCEYEQKIVDLTQPPLQFTDVVNLNIMNKIFRCNALNSIKVDEEEDINVIKKRNPFGRWQKSVSTLHNYKDALVKDILSIWDIEFENEEKFVFEKSSQKQENSQQLVQNWLENYGEPPMTDIPRNNISQIMNESINMSFEDSFEPAIISTQIVDETFTMNESSILKSQQNISQKKKLRTEKRKSKYVKGF